MNTDVSEFSAATYAYRFGSWRRSLEEFQIWSQETDIEAPKENAAKPNKRTPRSVNSRLTVKVLMRDGATCRLCGASPPAAKMHVDHVIPWSKGGETTIENLQILCERCNLGKSDLTFPD